MRLSHASIIASSRRGNDGSKTPPVDEGGNVTPGGQPYEGLAHAVSTRDVTYAKGFVLGHVMSNNHPTSDDKHYQLTYMGAVSSSSTLPGGLKLGDYGKSWKANDTGNLWTWTGNDWTNQGDRPAYNKIGEKYWNPDDYTVKHFMPPSAARPAEVDRLYFGEQRDMAKFVPRHGGTTDEWYIHNAKQVIRDAIKAGCDGFTLHMPQIGETSTHWPRTKRYLRAAEQVMAEDGVKFLSILQPDCKSSGTAKVKIDGDTADVLASADAMADQILTVKDSPGILRINGKFVLSAFGAELWPSGLTNTKEDRKVFWTRCIKRMEDNGVPVFFAPAFLGTWANYATDPGWNAIVDLYGTWGDRDPTTLSSDTIRNRRAAGTCFSKYNKEYMFSVTPGDFRTRDRKTETNGTVNYGVIWEEGGFDALEESWKTAIGFGNDPSLYRKSKIAHYVTWDDYAEHSHMNNSLYNSEALSDYARYWLEWYKTGNKPTILRDVLYIRHRVQPYTGVTYTGLPEPGKTTLIKQTKFIGDRSDAEKGNTPIRNEVNMRALLVEPAKIEVLFDGVVVHTQDCAKGHNRIVTPLRNGIVSMRSIRNGVTTAVVTSNAPINMTSQPFQDLYPRTFSSERQKQ